jgi:O-antigen/teichoic acid export membrane protein
MTPEANQSKKATRNKDSQELFKQSGITGLGRFGNLFLRYIQTLLITRMLGAGDFGLYVLGRNTAQLVANIGAFGLGPTLTRLIPVNLTNSRAVSTILRYGITVSLISSIVLSLTLLLLSGWISEMVFHQPELEDVLFWFCLAIPIQSLLQVLYGTLRGYKKISARVFTENLIFPIVSIFILTIFSLLKLGLLAAIASYIISYILTAIFAGYFVNKIDGIFSKWKSIGKPDTEVKREVNQMAVPLLLSTSLDFVQKWADTFMLGILSTLASVGIYAITLRVAAFIQIPLTAMNMVFGPMVAEISALGDTHRLGQSYKLVTRTAFILSFPIFGLIFLLPQQVLSMFGKDFQEGSQALVLICFGQLINVAVGSTAQMLVQTGKAKTHMYNSIVFVVLTISLNWLLIPEYGIMGAAVANAITLGALNIMRLIQIYQSIKIHPFSRGFFATLLVGVSTLTASLFFQRVVSSDLNAWHQVSVAVVFVCLYALLTGLFGLGPDEKELLSSLWKKLSRKLGKRKAGD